MKWIITIIVAAVLFIVPAFSESPIKMATSTMSVQEAADMLERLEGKKGADVTLTRGILIHNMCAAGKTGRIEEGKQILENIKSPLSQGYYGSIVTLEGGIASKNGNLLKATQKVQKGFDLIDAAVKNDPENITLRVLRLENSLGVVRGSPFKRDDVLTTDSTFLVGKAAIQPAEVQAHIYYLAGDAAFEIGNLNDAFVYLENAIRSDPKSVYARKADDLLWQLEE